MKNKDLKKMKKFRFLLLHQWIIKNFEPCKVADVGGGKGLLAYLLNKNGFDSTVIDPFDQALPEKYKDLEGMRQKISSAEKVKRISADFQFDMAKNFDLLIGLHSHGSNMKILEASAKFNISFILLPCCVIDEPIEKRPNVDWFESLLEYAFLLGHNTKRFELNFSGQNMGFYAKK